MLSRLKKLKNREQKKVNFETPGLNFSDRSEEKNTNSFKLISPLIKIKHHKCKTKSPSQNHSFNSTDGDYNNSNYDGLNTTSGTSTLEKDSNQRGSNASSTCSKPSLDSSTSSTEGSSKGSRSSQGEVRTRPTAHFALFGTECHGEEDTDSMEVGVAYSSQQRGGRVGASPDRGRGSPKGSLHVDFAAPGEMKERKEKYLTAKYGAHQMALIRKRLGVEMWMFDQLQVLYPPKDGKSEEKEVDLDELLDLEDESKRRQFLRGRLSDCQLPQDLVEKFIDELMERATML